MKAMMELKNEVADISIQMAEKIIKTELKDTKSQIKLIEEDLKKAHELVYDIFENYKTIRKIFN